MTRNTPHLGPGVSATYVGQGQPLAQIPSNVEERAHDAALSTTASGPLGTTSANGPDEQNTTSSLSGEQQDSSQTLRNGLETLYASCLNKRQAPGPKAIQSISDIDAFKSHFDIAPSTKENKSLKVNSTASPPLILQTPTASSSTPEETELPKPYKETKPTSNTNKPDKKTPAAKTGGNFHATSDQIRLDQGRWLYATCTDRRGRRHESRIDLNDCLVNRSGKVSWERGGKFRTTARNCKLQENGRVLVCEAGDGKGGWKSNVVDLGEGIRNVDGVLKVV